MKCVVRILARSSYSAETVETVDTVGCIPGKALWNLDKNIRNTGDGPFVLSDMTVFFGVEARPVFANFKHASRSLRRALSTPSDTV